MLLFRLTPGRDTRNGSDARKRIPSVLRLPGSRRGRVALAGLIVALALPLVVGLVVMHSPRWYPLFDNAQTELRIRDVWSRHSPLIGLVGRLGSGDAPGSHPGPLSFWLLWPGWRLAGASAWGMQVSTAVLNILAMGAVVWMANRRGGLRMAAAVTVILGVLAAAFGAVLLEPWNPYLPVLWWVAFVVAIWCVLCDDLALLPLAVFAGSFFAQTHVSYLGLVPGLLVVAVLVAAFTARRNAEPGAVARFWRWTGIAAGVGVIVWLPSVIDEVSRSPGNLSVIRDTFRHPLEDPIGVRGGLDVLLMHLDPWRVLVRGDIVTGAARGSILPGVVLLVVWLAAAALAWRLRHRTMTRLNLAIGVSLVLGLVSASRIFGFPFTYLALWTWGLNVLMWLSIGWAVAIAIGRNLDGVRRALALHVGTCVLVAAAVVSSASFVVDASSMEPADSDMSTTLGKLVRPTVEALSEGAVAGGGHDGAYLVTWSDPVAFGSQGFGLVNELDREGFRVGAPEIYRRAVTPHRVLDPSDATAVVHLSIGNDIEVWRTKPGVEELAFVDPRTPAQLAQLTIPAAIFVGPPEAAE